MKYIRATILLMLFSALVFTPRTGAAGEGEKTVYTEHGLEGEVVSVDAGNSSLVVRKADVPEGGQSSGEITLTVVPETGITKGDTLLGLADLKPGDKATIDYQTDSSGNATAVSIYLEGDTGDDNTGFVIDGEPAKDWE